MVRRPRSAWLEAPRPPPEGPWCSGIPSAEHRSDGGKNEKAPVASVGPSFKDQPGLGLHAYLQEFEPVKAF